MLPQRLHRHLVDALGRQRGDDPEAVDGRVLEGLAALSAVFSASLPVVIATAPGDHRGLYDAVQEAAMEASRPAR